MSIYVFGQGLNEAKKEFLKKSYSNLDIQKSVKIKETPKVVEEEVQKSEEDDLQKAYEVLGIKL